ncbi:hypothetical protein [Marinovum sp.]|uniref:hypothetical protein n=1 Tax=Marinovum sp. TaxID=2024839 RepID=UPI003A9490A9
MRNVLSILVCLLCLALPGAALATCDTRNDGTIDLVMGQLDAGVYRREGFRISPDGTLSRALWNDRNELLGLSAPATLGAQAFKSAQGKMSRTRPRHAAVPTDGTIPSPPTFTIEIAYFDRGKTRFVFRNAATPALSELIEAWRAAAPLSRPPRGTYLWSILAPDNPGPADLDLGTASCGGGLGPDLAQALDAATMVAQAGPASGPFLKTHPGRSRFIADLPAGHAYFGILSGK